MKAPNYTPITVPPMKSLEEVRIIISQKLNDLQQGIIGSLPTTEFGGERLQDLGNPQQLSDAVTLQYLQSALQGIHPGKTSTSSIFTSGSSNGPAHTITVIAGSATPSAASAVNILVLTQDVVLQAPTGYSLVSTWTTPWMLLVQQDSTGGHSLEVDTTGGYYINQDTASAASPGSTQCILVFLTNSNGNTILVSSQINVPIAP